MLKHQLKIGDEVFIASVSGRGGHGAHVIIEKILRRSIRGTERERSYKPGTHWSISAPCEIALVGKDEMGRMTNSWGWLSDHGSIVELLYDDQNRT